MMRRVFKMKIIEYKLIDNCLAPYMVFPNLTFYEIDVDIFLMNKKNLVLFYIGEKKVIYSLNPYNAEIKLVRLNKKRLIAYADKKIFIYNLSNMKL